MEVTRNNVTAHIAGGFIVGILMIYRNGVLRKGGEITLKQKILSKTYPFQQVLYENMGAEFLEDVATIAYQTIIETGEAKEFAVNPITFIEAIAFDFEKELRSFYGDNLFEIISRLSNKNEGEVGDSYDFAENIKKLFRKKLYDKLKDVDWKK